MKRAIHLIGPFPPPYGGVSTHVGRLRRRLVEQGHPCTVWCSRDAADNGLRRLPAGNAAVRTLARDPSAIFHFHGKHLLAGRLAKLGRNVLFTVHNERINDDLSGANSVWGRWQNWRTRSFFRQVPRLLAVSERAREELVRFGFSSEAIAVVSAYLRPDSTEKAHPQNLLEFKKFRDQYGVILTACAWALKQYRGEDLYGIDLCLELLGKLAHSRQEIGLVLALPGSQGTPELLQLQERAARLGITPRVLFLLEAGAYHPLLGQSDLFLRPTNTDGFSISVAEAFECGVPVIASDAVPRPAGCLLFTNRELDHLVAQTAWAIDHLDTLKAQCHRFRIKDSFQDIFDVYQDIDASPRFVRQEGLATEFPDSNDGEGQMS